jgi:hypothetical protein
MINAGAVGSVSLQADWEAAHGIAYPAIGSSYNFKIGIMVVNVRIASGIMSPGLMAIATYTSIAGGIGYMSIETTFIVS